MGPITSNFKFPACGEAWRVGVHGGTQVPSAAESGPRHERRVGRVRPDRRSQPRPDGPRGWSGRPARGVLPCAPPPENDPRSLGVSAPGGRVFVNDPTPPDCSEGGVCVLPGADLVARVVRGTPRHPLGRTQMELEVPREGSGSVSPDLDSSPSRRDPSILPKDLLLRRVVSPGFLLLRKGTHGSPSDQVRLVCRCRLRTTLPLVTR